MNIIREGKKIFLTSEEIEAIYREKEHQYRLQDAERQFYNYICYLEDPDDESENNECIQRFTDKYGISPDEVVNDSGEHYLLETFVNEYEDNIDCNRAENDTWAYSISNVLNNSICNK